MKKPPPYGSRLVERQKWRNLPFLVVVFVGMGAWDAAKTWLDNPSDICPLLLPKGEPASRYAWPVSGCLVLVQRLPGPADSDVFDLVKELLRSGAEEVFVRDQECEPGLGLFSFWVEEG